MCMNNKYWIICLLLMLVLSISLYMTNRGAKQLFIEQEKHIMRLYNITDNHIEALKQQETELNDKIQELQKQLQEEKRQEKSIPTRGVTTKTFNVSAYDLSYNSCQKNPGDKGYGITASGTKVVDWQSIAADPSIPFGTIVYIPYFKDKPNNGIFIVDDRGGAIKGNKLDVFIRNTKDVWEFGRRNLEVHILKWGER